MSHSTQYRSFRRLTSQPVLHVNGINSYISVTRNSAITDKTAWCICVLCNGVPSLSPFKRPFSKWIWVSQYQNVSILDFVGAKDDGSGGNNWSYKTCKAPVKLSPPTNQHPVFLQAGCSSCHRTNSVRALKEKMAWLFPENIPPHMCYHANFGPSWTDCVHMSRG